MVSRRMRRIEKNVRLTSEQCVAHTDSQVGGDVGAEDLDEQQWWTVAWWQIRDCLVPMLLLQYPYIGTMKG